MSFPKFTSIHFFCKNRKKETRCVKIINKDKVLCIPAQTNRCLGRKQMKKKNKTKKKMAVTTVTITCSWYTLQHWSVSSPKNYKPQSNPVSLPGPNTILKYLSAHSKHISCSVFSVRSLKAAMWSSQRERREQRKHAVTVARLSSIHKSVYLHEALHPSEQADMVWMTA